MTNFNIAIALEALILHAKGWAPLEAPEEAAFRAALVGNASHFQTLMRTSYAYIQRTPISYLYTDPTVSILKYDTATAPPDGLHMYVNLVDGCSMFTTYASAAGNLSLAELADDNNPVVRFLLVNDISGGHLHEDMSATLGSGFELSRNTASTLQLTQVIVLSAMGGLLLLIVFAAFVPILLSIERAKDAIMSAFVHLPIVVRLLLQRTVERRMRALQEVLTDDEGADTDGVLDAPEDDATRRSGTSSSGGGGVEKLVERYRIVGSEEGEDAIDWERVVAVGTDGNKSGGPSKRGAAPAGRKRRGGRKPLVLACCPRDSTRVAAEDAALSNVPTLRKSSRSLALLLVRFLFPLFALFSYYVVMFVVCTSTLQTTLTLQAALAASGNRAACSREVLLDVRRDMMVYGDRPFIATRRLQLEDTVSCVTWHQELLLYGAPEGVPLRGSYAEGLTTTESGHWAGLSATDNNRIFDFQFSNACPFIATSPDSTVKPGTREQCESFDRGSLKLGGMASFVLKYVNEVDKFSDARLRARLFVGERLGNGILLPAATYNYSQDVGEAFTAGNTDTIGDADLEGPPPHPLASYVGDIDAASAWLVNGTLNYSMAATFASDAMLWLTTADALFVGPGLMHLCTLYFNAGDAQITSLLNFITVFTTAFYVSFVLYIVFVFLPQVTATNKDIAFKRSMLLLLPAPVINSSFSKTLEAIFSEDETLARANVIDASARATIAKSTELD